MIRIPIAVAAILVLSACSSLVLTRTADTTIQPPLLLTASQEIPCTTYPLAELNLANARQELVKQAVAGADCRDKVESVALSIKEYNASVRLNLFFERTVVGVDENATCSFPEIVAGSSPNRLSLLLGALSEATQACANTQAMQVAAVTQFNAGLTFIR